MQADFGFGLVFTRLVAEKTGKFLMLSYVILLFLGR